MRRGLLAGLAALLGCQPAAPRLPPGLPPTPASISKAEPGGDAANPEQAALERLASEAWGSQPDKRGRVLVPLPDASRWRRVRFWLVPTFTGFRFGDRHHAISALFVRQAPEGGSDSAACLREFERWGGGVARQMGLETGEATDFPVRWRGQTVLVRQREGNVFWLTGMRHYAAVYASYPAWSGACATLAYAFPMDEARDEALRARSRVALGAFARFSVIGPSPL